MLYLIHLVSLMEYILNNSVLTPGPVAVPEFVMLEMAKPLIHHRTSEFEEIFYNATEDLKKLFQTKEEVLILASSGTGAMEAAVSNSFWEDSCELEEILIEPSSSISTLLPEVSQISLITFPPDPITSLILSTGIESFLILGA